MIHFEFGDHQVRMPDPSVVHASKPKHPNLLLIFGMNQNISLMNDIQEAFSERDTSTAAILGFDSVDHTTEIDRVALDLPEVVANDTVLQTVPERMVLRGLGVIAASNFIAKEIMPIEGLGTHSAGGNSALVGRYVQKLSGVKSALPDHGVMFETPLGEADPKDPHIARRIAIQYVGQEKSARAHPEHIVSPQSQMDKPTKGIGDDKVRPLRDIALSRGMTLLIDAHNDISRQSRYLTVVSPDDHIARGPEVKAELEQRGFGHMVQDYPGFVQEPPYYRRSKRWLRPGPRSGHGQFFDKPRYTAQLVIGIIEKLSR